MREKNDTGTPFFSAEISYAPVVQRDKIRDRNKGVTKTKEIKARVF